MIPIMYGSPSNRLIGPSIHYTIMPHSQNLDVDLLLKLPPGGPLNRAYYRIIGEALLDDTRDYGHQELIQFTAPTGELIRCEVLRDSIHVWFAIRTADAGALPGIIDNLLFHASLHQNDVQKALKRLEKTEEGYWHLGYGGEILPFRDVRLRDLRISYRHIALPRNVFISVSGTKSLAYLKRKIESVVANESSIAAGYFARDPLAPEFLTTGSRPIDSIAFIMPVVHPEVEGFTTDLLTMFALGSGKGSILFKDLRQKAEWSYRQEAFFESDLKGLRPIVEIASTHVHNPNKEASQARLIISQAIDHLSKTDVERAVAMAKAVFRRGIGMNPFAYLSKDQSPLFFNNYWRMKTGHKFHINQLVQLMESVPVKSVMQTAKSLFGSAVVRVVMGKSVN